MQLAELLKKKILQLSRDESNRELSEHATQQNADVAPVWFGPRFELLCFSSAKEILELQLEVGRLRELMSGAKTVIDTQLRGEKSNMSCQPPQTPCF